MRLAGVRVPRRLLTVILVICFSAAVMVGAGRTLGNPHVGGASATKGMAMSGMAMSGMAMTGSSDNVATAPAAPLTPAPGAAGQPLAQPPVYTSHHGVVNVTLVASSKLVTIAGRPVVAKVYNGVFTAPTLVVSPGDLVRVKLVNQLDEPTNLHFHGLEVSPSGHADNIFVSVDPGESFQYSFRLPRTAPTGTFWYHSHEMVPMDQMTRYPNAGSEEQVFDGLSGLIEVKGLTKDLPRRMRGLTQRYLALRDVQVLNGQIVSRDIDSDAPTTRLVDGQYEPKITIAPGQTELWHIANIGADIFYQLSLPGHTFEVVAQDGHPVVHPQASPTLLLPPGKRWDVLVRGGHAGVAALRTLYYNQGDDHYPTQTLATVVTSGRPRKAARMPSVISRAWPDLSRFRVARRRTIVLSENPSGSVFYVNGQTYDPSKINFHARLNTVEEWTIVNHTDETHPFHMHTYPMRELSTNGVPIHFNGYQDEIVVPPNGYIVMRVRFSQFTGETVFHCHIMAHEDMGMMANIEVTR